jgi:hypothetical protein
MKKLLIISLVLFASCKQSEFDQNKGREICDKAIKLINDRNYSELANLYDDDFKSSETPEVRTEKFDKILNVIGKMKVDSLISTKNNSDEDSDRMIFTYKVVAENLTVNEEFLISKESGDYRIAKIDIEQQK